MKAIKKMLYAALIVAPLLLPAKSNANPIGDLLGWLFGNGNQGNNNQGNNNQGNNNQGNNNGGSSNSAPIDSGLLILLAAGTVLGIKVLNDQKKKGSESY